MHTLIWSLCTLLEVRTYTCAVIRSELSCSGATCTNSLGIMNEAKGTLPIASFFVLT